jgi:dihydrofolate reductase
MKLLSLIAAVSQNNVIGNNNTLPWGRIPQDMKLFRGLTTGNAIIMGRKTFDSLGQIPLPNRQSIVISRNPTTVPGVLSARNLDEAIELGYKHSDTPFIIGGAQVYADAIYKADIAYISHILGNYEGDVTFPPVDFSQYKILQQQEFPEFTFRKYRLK